MTRAHRGSSCGAPAFSLVEVLIGILILALGLLGLGAIIPVVVREQRAGSDLTLGQAVLSDAEHYLLRSRPDLDPSSIGTTGWDLWLASTGNNGWSSGNDSWLWEPWHGQGQPTGTPNEIDPTTGNFSFIDAMGGTDIATVRIADRLWPPLSRQPSTTIARGLDPHRPQFVWDFIGRRMRTAPGEPEKIQLAIFVRRIDLNIRVPRDDYPGSNPARSITLYDILTQRTGLPGTYPYRVPLAAYAGSGAGTGTQYLPTNTGIVPPGASSANLNYSAPLVEDADYDIDEPDRIEFPNLLGTSTKFKLLSQPGQKLVDNLGNVYTVIAEPDEITTNAEVHIEPRIPSWVADPNVVQHTLPNGEPNPAMIHQIAFVPQIPAAVKVITITRPVP